VYGHFDVVTAITRSECNLNQDCYVVTGSKDCTVMVWMFTSRNQAIIGDNGSTSHIELWPACSNVQNRITVMITTFSLLCLLSLFRCVIKVLSRAGIEQPTPKATLTGHKAEVTCVNVLAELGLVISGSLGR